MNLTYWVAGAAAALVLCYLVAALLNAEDL